MRILLVVHDYLPYFPAGVENYTKALSDCFAARGHEVYVLAVNPLAEGEQWVERREDGKSKVVVHHIKKIPKNSTSYYLSHNDKTFGLFQKVFEEFAPDVVHIQHLMNHSIKIVKYCESKGVQTFFTLHDFWMLCPLTTFLQTTGTLCTGREDAKCSKCIPISRSQIDGGFFTRLFLKMLHRLMGQASFSRLIYSVRDRRMKDIARSVDFFIAPSRFLKERFVQWGLTEEKIRVIRNGSTFPQMDQARAVVLDPKNVGDKITFGVLAYVSEKKGIHIALEAFAKLNSSGVDNIELKIYGPIQKDSPYAIGLMRLAEENIDITFMGEFESSGKAEIFHDIDCLIVPSIWYENAPLVIDEAFGYKVPCIVSDIGGMKESVIDHVNGRHFTSGDAHSLAEVIKEIVQQPDLLEVYKLGIPAIKDMEKHSEELIALYEGRTAGAQTEDVV